MSILSEYEDIKKGLTREQVDGIELFLKFHPSYSLGDVYYKEDVFKECEAWCKQHPAIDFTPEEEKEER